MSAPVWRESRYRGQALPFARIEAADDRLHAVAQDAPFTMVETYLHGFNIPAQHIYCNIYLLWHTVLKTLSAHVFVYRGARILEHQLCADYFNDQQFLPASTTDGDFSLSMGSARLQHRIADPLQCIELQCDDPAQAFSLQLTMTAALPPVGRPGGKHFTQLMRTAGRLVLDGQSHVIDGYYMRDRSWSYPRPESPERVPPYRWFTGWLGEDLAFVIAWMDTGLLDDARFGPKWQQHAAGAEQAGANKWESGGATPSTELRSGWIAVRGDIRAVVGMTVRSRFGGQPRFLTSAIELELTDATGEIHRIAGETVAMIPKMYWQTMLTYMHAVELRCGTLRGQGDLMDTFSTWHMTAADAPQLSATAEPRHTSSGT